MGAVQCGVYVKGGGWGSGCEAGWTGRHARGAVWLGARALAPSQSHPHPAHRLLSCCCPPTCFTHLPTLPHTPRPLPPPATGKVDTLMHERREAQEARQSQAEQQKEAEQAANAYLHLNSYLALPAPEVGGGGGGGGGAPFMQPPPQQF